MDCEHDSWPKASDRQLDATTVCELTVALARRGPAHGPNPRVGCLLLDPHGGLIGQGWHMGTGTDHAEVAALAHARAQGHDTRGATAIVTLEPCSHTGRTGPCTQALAQAEVSQVLYAVADPGQDSGGGAAWLRNRGIRAYSARALMEADTAAGPQALPDAAAGLPGLSGQVLALWQRECMDLVRYWDFAVRNGRPWVTVKLSTTADGMVAALDGSSQWISSDVSRDHAHEVRSRIDAIAVTTGTALADNPSLTARYPNGSLYPHQPLRVVVGMRDVPEGSHLRGAGGGDFLHLRSHDVTAMLDALHDRQVRHLLIEGGPALSSAVLAAGVVDEVHHYVSPILMGQGRSAVGPFGVTSLGQAPRWDIHQVTQLGNTVFIEMRH